MTYYSGLVAKMVKVCFVIVANKGNKNAYSSSSPRNFSMSIADATVTSDSAADDSGSPLPNWIRRVLARADRRAPRSVWICPIS